MPVHSTPRSQPPEPRQPGGPKRALLLLRVSDLKQTQTDYDPEGISIPAQRAAGQRKAKELGAVIPADGEYVEPGYSGRSIDKRPIFREMIQRLKERQDADYVIVYALSRFARNVYD